ncbi:glycoside hydrolase family 3 N-terminal domain-containing protein [Vibrio sp. E150_011]
MNTLSYKNVELSTEERVSNLVGLMTLEEKIGQLCQSPMLDYDTKKDAYLTEVKAGMVGSRILADTAWAGNAPGESVDPHQINEIQRVAVEQSRLGIPIIFARDVIYGQSTVLPIPLAQSCSWNETLVTEAYQYIACEASALGIHWTFAPMMDVVRDPRWGRVIESFGEDPYINGLMAAAVIKGFQGDDLSAPTSMVACAKHFVGYGASESGCDYDTTELSENSLANTYLPPFTAAINAGVRTFMSGFNDLGGTPVTASKPLISGWLKDQSGFDGFVVSDWGSISDLHHFGVAKNEIHAATLALDAGVDMAMTSEAYRGKLDKALEKGALNIEQLDQAVTRVLRVKVESGLFERPYVDVDKSQSVQRLQSHIDKATELATQSMVLLRNNDQTLPLKRAGHTYAVIGPHAHTKRQHLGSWCLDGNKDDVVSIYEGVTSLVGIDSVLTEYSGLCDEWLECAHRADAVILCVGESHRSTGEARNLAELALPAGQEEMIKAVAKSGKPMIVVQCGGRPIPSESIQRFADAHLLAWQGGTETGNSVAALLFGDASPSGKLTMTIPKSTGQIPIYYNKKPLGKMRDYAEYRGYKDVDMEPLYPFGYGLTYASFEYEKLCVKSTSEETISVTFTLRNTSQVIGTEICQLYMTRDYSTTTRPTKSLLAFRRVELQPGQTEVVTLDINIEQLGYFETLNDYKNPASDITFWVGSNSKELASIKVSESDLYQDKVTTK